MLDLLIADTSPLSSVDSNILVEGTPEAGGAYIGAVGSFVGALLQTAGLYAQGEVLANFGYFFQAVGTWIYLIVLIGGLIGIATSDNTKDILYYLLGPALFVWVISATVPVQGALERFGARVTTDSVVNQREFLEVAANIGSDDGDTEISQMFVYFDNVVTFVVQNMVAMLLDTENLADIHQSATERVYSRVMLANSSEPAFLRLIAEGTMGDCAEANRINAEIKSIDTAGPLRWKLPELENQKQYFESKHLNVAPEIYTYASSLRLDVEDIDVCPNARNLMLEVQSDGGLRNYSFSCKDIWTFTCIASNNEAKRVFDEEIGDYNELREGIITAIADSGDEAMATQLLAARILKNSMEKTAHSAMSSSIQDKTRYNDHRYRVLYGALAEADAKAGRGFLMYFMATLPYFQGIILFLLSMLFPFFAFFLLIPGQWQSFFLWMGLWIWVKSWDVGFAMVHFIKEFLWDFMQTRIGSEQELDWSSADSVYAVMTANDPSATTNIYYLIVGLLTVTVPFITAQFSQVAYQVYEALKEMFEDSSSLFHRRYRTGRRIKEIYSPRETESDLAAHNYAMEKTMEDMKTKFGDGAKETDQKFLEEALTRTDGSLSREVNSIYQSHKGDFILNRNGAGTQWLQLRQSITASYSRVDAWTAGSSSTIDKEAYKTAYMNERTGHSVVDPYSPHGSSSNTTATNVKTNVAENVNPGDD